VIVQVCEAVKLYLDGPGLIFVMACDLAVLARSAAAPARGGQGAGRSYLEKIVQVAYRVPPPEGEQIKRLIAGYGKQSGTTDLIDETVMGILSERSGRNPRRIKRIINSFVLEYQLNPAWREPPLDSSQLVIAILLQHLYTVFYDYLVDEDSSDDPVGDFLDYARVRSRISDSPGPDDAWWSVVRRTFQRLELSAPDRATANADQLLQDVERLERVLPDGFLALARSKTFVSLLAGVGDKSARLAFRAELVNRPLGTSETLESPSSR
jgi:hypothetical protein